MVGASNDLLRTARQWQRGKAMALKHECYYCKRYMSATSDYFVPIPPRWDTNKGVSAVCLACNAKQQRKRYITDVNFQLYEEKRSLIYFLLITEDRSGNNRTGLIKIGRTVNLRQRLYLYKHKDKVGFEIIGTIKGGPILEAILLERFSPYLAWGNEWFHPAPELCDYFECTFEELIQFDPENEYDTPTPDEE